MLTLQDLSTDKAVNKKRKRVGRGPGSGNGLTGGRGHKGSQSRANGSGKPYPGFEGGQTPLYKRIPKLRGYKNKSLKKIKPFAINVSDLEKLSETDIDINILQKFNVIPQKTLAIKVLGDGEVKKALTLKVDAISKSAQAKIEKSGGKVEIVSSVKLLREISKQTESKKEEKKEVKKEVKEEKVEKKAVKKTVKKVVKKTTAKKETDQAEK